MSMFNQLKQVKDLRKQAKQYKNTMGDEQATGQAGDGAVKVTIDGTQKVESVEVDESILQPENKQKIEQYFVEASKDAQKQLQKVMMAKYKSGELKLPELG